MSLLCLFHIKQEYQETLVLKRFMIKKIKIMTTNIDKASFRELSNSKLSGIHTFDNVTISFNLKIVISFDLVLHSHFKNQQQHSNDHS